MILEINPSFVEMNDLMGVFYTAGEAKRWASLFKDSNSPGAGVRVSHPLALISCRFCIWPPRRVNSGAVARTLLISAHVPRGQSPPPPQEPGGVDIPPVAHDALVRLPGKRAVPRRKNNCART